MTRIAPVHLAYNPKTLWFDAGDYELAADQGVVVQTARGLEYGRMAGAVFEATREQVAGLKTPLKPVERPATPEDEEQAQAMEKLSREALGEFKRLAAEFNEEMRPISVEYLLDGDKAVFYFEAEDRIDFRDLVRQLAAQFHVRIDMRQIGVRDEARMVGGLGHCGQELCCKRLGGDFNPVSIRMAKEQGLSLNPQKISGICGRLMCCLRYEYEAYKDFNSRAPKHNSTVQTPDGPAKVASLDVPREIVVLKVQGQDKPVKVPLADFDPPEEGSNRPKVVGQKAWDAANAPEEINFMADSTFLTSQFTGSDMLGNAKAVRRNNANVKNATGSTPVGGKEKAAGSGRKRRTRSGRDTAAKEAQPVERKARRRRSTKLTTEGKMTQAVVSEELAQKHRPSRPAAAAAEDAAAKPSRRRRRRSSGGASAGADKAASQQKRTGAQKNEHTDEQKPRVRPGQKSSGLARKRAEDANKKSAAEGASEQEGRRRRRRRPRGKGQGGAQGGAQAGKGASGEA